MIWVTLSFLVGLYSGVKIKNKKQGSLHKAELEREILSAFSRGRLKGMAEGKECEEVIENQIERNLRRVK